MKYLNKFFVVIALFFLVFSSIAFAQDTSPDTNTDTSTDTNTSDSLTDSSGGGVVPDALSESLLIDRNGNGTLDLIAFGDSIARGRGDFIAANEEVFSTDLPESEAGFPLRVELMLNILVSDLGIPGERLADQGLFRFAESIPAAKPDIVFISGGSNDAFDGISVNKYFRSVQTMINIARASGVLPILLTIPPTCCDRSSLLGTIEAYNRELHRIVLYNSITLADIDHAFRNTCTVSTCFLLNRPEGLHPNIEGYDVMGETVISSLLGIDIFASDGPSTLESALNLTPGAVKTVPDIVIEPEPTPAQTSTTQ